MWIIPRVSSKRTECIQLIGTRVEGGNWMTKCKQYERSHRRTEEETNGQDKQKAQNKIWEVNPNTLLSIISTNGLKASVEDKL